MRVLLCKNYYVKIIGIFHIPISILFLYFMLLRNYELEKAIFGWICFVGYYITLYIIAYRLYAVVSIRSDRITAHYPIFRKCHINSSKKVYYAFFHEQVLLADGILQKEDNYIILSHQPLLPRTTKTWIMHFNTSTQICIPYNQKTHIVLQEHLCKDNWIWDGGKLASEEELEDIRAQNKAKQDAERSFQFLFEGPPSEK